MPDIKEHREISKERTGKEFKELHEWIDEARKFIGFNHRLERHFYTTDYENFIEGKWGQKAVVEWLFHIAIDNLETANKFAIGAYNKSYDEISVEFQDKEISVIKFFKKFANSKKWTTYKKL